MQIWSTAAYMTHTGCRFAANGCILSADILHHICSYDAYGCCDKSLKFSKFFIDSADYFWKIHFCCRKNCIKSAVLSIQTNLDASLTRGRNSPFFKIFFDMCEFRQNTKFQFKFEVLRSHQETIIWAYSDRDQYIIYKNYCKVLPNSNFKSQKKKDHWNSHFLIVKFQ